MNTLDSLINRRAFIKKSAAVAGLALLSGPLSLTAADEQTEEVSPPEDLMREHGALNRILLIYEEFIRRLNAEKVADLDVLASAAGIIRRFIEGYHEKLEESHLFPRFEKAGKLVDLVIVLKQQHDAGRRLTERIEAAGKASAPSDAERRRIVKNLSEFIRMYRPHEAREDTVLFPALRSIVSKNEFDALGEDFEKKEHELFGRDGFEGVVEKIDGLEKRLGIENLAQFTPAP